MKKVDAYQIVTNIIMILWTIIIIAPFLLLFMSSITEENVLVANGYSFFPAKFSIASYAYIIRSGATILKSYAVSIGVTAVGTLVSVILSAMMAYPLSLRNLPGRRVLMFLVFFTMLFSGGIVPSYIMWSNTFHIKDTIFAQLLPNLLLSAWNVMMIRTYFSTSIPDALYEAAEIDGASQIRIFRIIALPLGKPILVTIGTFAGLGYWNDWTNGLYYISKNKDLYNVQNLLNQMVQNIQYLATSTSSNANAAAASLPATGIQMAIAFVAILPIMLIFPFFQKYYAKGIAVGAVKG
ncbi:MAG: carbohydrate ABC transporter permease [Oscillospiraceae bacterium]|nr:carbohydrate ABC transporter permease [Oscillospiraceae bacterium]